MRITTLALVLLLVGCGGAAPGQSDAGSTRSADGSTYWARVNLDGGSPDGGYPDCVGQAWPLEGATHVPEPTRVTYHHNPPASGSHWPCWAPWAIATRVLPKERFVHNLEHGGIVLLYHCDEPDGGFAPDAFADGGSPCPEEARTAAALVNGAPNDPQGARRYVVSARPDLPTRYAAVSWGFTLERDSLDPATFGCFVNAHLAQGPEDTSADPPPDECPQVYPP